MYLLATCNSLKSPVLMFMGNPKMMHSRHAWKQPEHRSESSIYIVEGTLLTGYLIIPKIVLIY